MQPLQAFMQLFLYTNFLLYSLMCFTEYRNVGLQAEYAIVWKSWTFCYVGIQDFEVIPVTSMRVLHSAYYD